MVDARKRITSSRLALFVAVFVSLIGTEVSQAGRGGSRLIEGEGDIQIEFQGRNVPRASVNAKISSGRKTESGVADYELTIRGWSSAVAQQCREGIVHLRYHVAGPIYKDRKTGNVANPNSQALMALGSFLSNQDGTDDAPTFNAENYNASQQTVKIRSNIAAPGCASSIDYKLEPMCAISWESAAEIECYN